MCGRDWSSDVCSSDLFSVQLYSHHSSSPYITIHIIPLLCRKLFASSLFSGHHYSHYSSSVYIPIHITFFSSYDKKGYLIGNIELFN